MKEGKNVIYDATAHKAAWRAKARSAIKNFMEVHVKCSIEDCIERETKRKDGLVQAELYKKALERKRTGKKFQGLGKVAGIDVPYEEGPKAEVMIDSGKLKPEEAAGLVLMEISKRGWK